jgi:hypothetical protein
VPTIGATTVTRARSSASKGVACASAVTTPGPGGAHHPELDRAGGHWAPAVVRGRLRGGPFPSLTPMPGADPFRVQLLRAAEGLPNLWERLDEIEGAAYERISSQRRRTAASS